MAALTLDVHAHVWVDGVEELARTHPDYQEAAELEQRRLGAVSAAVNAEQWGYWRALLTDITARLTAMNTTGVDAQLISVVPTQYHGWADRDLAAQLAEVTNVGIAEHCALAPDRLAGLGVVPLQHPEIAVASLRSAVLDHGLKGVQISSHAVDPGGGGTIELSDPRLDPLWRTACELEAVVLLHPWGCTLNERLDRWYLANSVGQPVEHAVALSHLIFGGVFDRHRSLRFIAAHGGGYLPAFSARADHAWRNRRDAQKCLELPSAYLRRIWFDSLVHTPEALRNLVHVAGHDRVLFGTDYPFDMGEANPGATLRAVGLDPVEVSAIAGQNAVDLNLSPVGRG